MVLERSAPGQQQPRFSIVSAVYNVARYLPEFIESIDAQTFPSDRLEVIAVDDGSTDESLAILHAWQARRPDVVRVLTKSNGGQASARNFGLQQARGEWVTFTDPDDFVNPEYLQVVDSFLADHPTTALVATRRVLLNDATREETDHPLESLFTGGDRLRNLNENPSHFHGSAPAAFFRRPTLVEHELGFDDQIRPNFEDGHFCSLYLLQFELPLVAFLSSAVYFYRKRGDGSSTLDTSVAHPGRYTAVPRRGFLPLLRLAAEKYGRAPQWLQTQILYDLSWYFTSQDRPAGVVSAAHGEIADEFHSLLGQLVEYLDPDVVSSFALRPYKRTWVDFLLHGYATQPWFSPYVILTHLDTRQKLVRLVYRFTKELPEERFVVDGVSVEPLHGKIADIPLFDRSLIHERIVWIPLGSTRVMLGGREVEIRTYDQPRPVHFLSRWWVNRKLNPGAREPAPKKDRVALANTWAINRLARSRPVQRRFKHAWVLIDRVHDADDSAEHLFRYLRKRQRKTNAWFVVEKGTADYKRLKADGYKRVIAHGSLLWKLLMINCEHLISSHADEPIVNPPQLKPFRPQQWRFTFLQHGVTKDDLSPWLNGKKIDVFVTSTPAEYESLVADHTAYRYTTKEVVLTGLPRFDQVLEEGERVPAAERDLILLTPTWRNWLAPALAAGSQRRTLVAEEVLSSEFATEWLGLINSPELASLAEREKLTVGLLLHPNLQPVLAAFPLPAHVRAFTFEGENVRRLFARARVLVTDYSSMAFNAAYIDRPVVYFQFDRERVLGGGHVGRKGYFDYERDGFGPVSVELAAAVAAITAAVEFGPQPQPVYLARNAAAFPDRDGKCSQRTFQAIRNSTRTAHSANLQAAAADGPPAVGEPSDDQASASVASEGDSSDVTVVTGG